MRQKKIRQIKLVWWFHQLLSGFLANGHLPRVSRQSRLSANDKDNNEMIPEAVQISAGICVTAEENLSGPDLQDCKLQIEAPQVKIIRVLLKCSHRRQKCYACLSHKSVICCRKKWY